MPDRLGESLNKNKNQEYFEKNLDKESYDFLVQLVESGIYSWEEIERKVKLENKKIIWKGKLDIRGTNVKKIKAKRIEGNVSADGVESLEEIEVEEIRGNLDIKGTNVKKIKAKWIGGHIYADGVKNLEDIEVEEKIGGDLNIEGTKLAFQLKVIKKVRNKKLEVKGKVYYDDIISIFADKEGKLKDIANIILSIKERYGESLKNIENEELKKEAIDILEYINSKVKKEIQTKIVEYANRGGETQGEGKKEIVKKIVGYSEEYEKWKKFYNKFMGK